MDLTVRDAGDLTIWIGAICGALLGIGAFVHAFVVRPLRRFIRAEMREVSAPLQTSNGKSLGEFVEGSAGTLDAIRTELSTTNTLALQNQVALLEMGRRFDEHLVRDHSASGPKEGSI